MTRTSESHPLQIDTVDVGNGRLGLTFCPGKKQPEAMSGSWNRDLDLDLDRVEDWGADAVVTLLEPDEMDTLQVPLLGERVESRGVDWHHLSIPDGGVPDRNGEARWFFTSVRLRKIVRRGGAVVFHCKGGLGRTGMMAARLLVELGERPEDAIGRVRKARKGSIETRGQEHSVMLGQQIDEGGVGPDRILGCLVGGAVGDAFGYAIEFDKMDRIREVHGPEGLVEPRFARGKLVVSDDTQMTMFTAEGLLRAAKRSRQRGICCPVSVIWYAYRRWRRTQGCEAETPIEDGWLVHEPDMHHRRAPGNTCLSALVPSDPPEGYRASNDSKGCGGVMRVAPIGLLTSYCDPRETFNLARDCAALTHGHFSGYLAAGAMGTIIRELIEGNDTERAVERALRRLSDEEGAEETIGKLAEALELSKAEDFAESFAIARLGEGWVAEEALAIGLYAALRGRDFADVIRLAANHDGDSDSTASIAAQIHGARRGIDGLPQAWIRRLDLLDPLLVLAHDLWAFNGSPDRALESYPPN